MYQMSTISYDARWRKSSRRWCDCGTVVRFPDYWCIGCEKEVIENEE